MQPCRSESSVTGLSAQSQANSVYQGGEKKREVGEKKKKKRLCNITDQTKGRAPRGTTNTSPADLLYV